MPLIDGHEITVTHPDKVLFPADSITKGELVEYYQSVAERMIPHVRDRPLHMNRFPGGIAYNPIQQKRVPDTFPPWIKRATVDLQRGGTITHAVIDNAATLAYLANYNMVTAHVWLSRIQAPNQPDQVMFDLDPADEDFGLVRRTALTLKTLLEEMKLVPFVKTTGSRGLHVVVPITVGPSFRRGSHLCRRRRPAAGGRRPRAPDYRVHQAEARRSTLPRRQPKRLRPDGGRAVRGSSPPRCADRGPDRLVGCRE